MRRSGATPVALGVYTLGYCVGWEVAARQCIVFMEGYDLDRMRWRRP